MIYLILLLISFLSHWEWVTNLSILTSGDWVFQYPQILKEFLSLPWVWTPTSLGSINLGISFTPFMLLYGILSSLHLQYGLSERLVFLWPILIIFPTVSYFFIKKIIPNTPAAIIGSFLYSYNTYFFELQTGELTQLIAIAFFPLVFYLFKCVLEERKLKYIILTSIIGFVVSFYEFRMFYIFFIERKKDTRNFFKITIAAILPIIIIFLLNLYWILGFAKTGSLVSNAAFDRSLFGNEFLNILHAFTLHHPFWTGKKTAIFEVQSIPFFFWLIPIFAFYGLYLNRKNKLILFFGFITLFGIFLTKQVALPFTGVYPWMYKNFPGFNAFREASKFFVLIVFGYSVLIASFVDWIMKHSGPNRIYRIGKYVLVIIIAWLFLWNLKPIVTGDFKTMVTPRHIPDDYLVVKDFIESQPDSFRTLWVPTFSRWSMYSNQKPEVSMVDNLNGLWGKFVQKESKMNKYNESELMVKILQKPFASNLLNESSIKFVFIPLQDSANDDGFFQNYGNTREYYVDNLSNLKFLRRISIGTEKIIVYENSGFRPHIYITNRNETIYKKISYQKVKFVSVNPTQYTVSLQNVKALTYLNFAESYHPAWRVRVGDFHWLATIDQHDYFLADSVHKQSDAGLNTFIIDPQKVCSRFLCSRNADGSYNMRLTIYFQPQSYVYLGMIVSSVTFIIILLYLGYVGLSKLRIKSNLRN